MVKTSKESLENLFEDLLQSVFWAEKHLAKVLPKMAKATQNKYLQQIFEGQLKNTDRHLLRLQNSFELFSFTPHGRICYPVKGLVKESKRVIKKNKAGPERDVALIAAVNKIQQYEISAYGALMTLAIVLGDIACAKLLELSKEEEVESDTRLTQLAETLSNSLPT